jgi:hypothetical protein
MLTRYDITDAGPNPPVGEPKGLTICIGAPAKWPRQHILSFLITGHKRHDPLASGWPYRSCGSLKSVRQPIAYSRCVTRRRWSKCRARLAPRALWISQSVVIPPYSRHCSAPPRVSRYLLASILPVLKSRHRIVTSPVELTEALVFAQIAGPEPNTLRAVNTPTVIARLSPAPPGKMTMPGFRCSGNLVSSKKSRSWVKSIRWSRHA